MIAWRGQQFAQVWANSMSPLKDSGELFHIGRLADTQVATLTCPGHVMQ